MIERIDYNNALERFKEELYNYRTKPYPYINNFFGNSEFVSNGELTIYNILKDKINIIYDVGTETNSLFLNFNGIVHYFDPVEKNILELKSKSNNNKHSYFNYFGLSNNNCILPYYPTYGSFLNRNFASQNPRSGIETCKKDDSNNKIFLELKTGYDYLNAQSNNTIDFLKIDVEGYEFNVIKGFKTLLQNIKIIQFEYGGCWKDANIKLIDVINYLKKYGFYTFYYISKTELLPIIDFNDHYTYCNILTINDLFNNNPMF